MHDHAHLENDSKDILWIFHEHNSSLLFIKPTYPSLDFLLKLKGKKDGGSFKNCFNEAVLKAFLTLIPKPEGK